MAVDFSFLTAASDVSNLTTYTFAAQNIGTADSGRHVIVAIQSRGGSGSSAISTVTVGGVSATIVQQQFNNAGGANVAGIAIAAVPTGTTGDIVVTFSTGQSRAAIQAYRAVGLDSATPNDGSTSTAAAPTYAIHVPAGGIAVGCGCSNAGGTATWTGITEDSDAVVESLICATSASSLFASEQTGLSLTCTFSSSSGPVGAFASWGAAAGTAGQPAMRRFGGVDNANFRCGSEGVKMWRVEPRPSGLLLPDRSLVIPQPDMRLAS